MIDAIDTIESVTSRIECIGDQAARLLERAAAEIRRRTADVSDAIDSEVEFWLS
ncbi:MAG TPA: hypothetical protein VEF72_19105 [Mycobacterium sp.]|jgi:hypothetical protein|nr:hypothetical protein [Mycobacterium sp.]